MKITFRRFPGLGEGVAILEYKFGYCTRKCMYNNVQTAMYTNTEICMIQVKVIQDI